MYNETVSKVARSVLVGAMLLGRVAVGHPSDTPDDKVPAATAACKVAIVNPISGFAECVRPPGAPVDPPPPRPQPIKLAVFDFELDDATPAAALPLETGWHAHNPLGAMPELLTLHHFGG